MSEGVDLAVIGGGLIGSSIAWGAARAGADVLLLDEGDLALRATRGNFGLVWLQGKGLGHPDYMHWSIRAGRLWPELDRLLREETGLDSGWRGGGGLNFCLSDADLEARRDMIARTAAEGGDISIRLLDRDEVASIAPGIGPEVLGASISDLDGEANPLSTLRAFQVGFQRHGGTLRNKSPVQGLRPAPGGGFQITCADGDRLRARKVVIAAGLGTTDLAAQVGLHLPLSPERGQIVVTERVAPFLNRPTNTVRQTREGTVLIGSSHEDAGFSTGTDVATIARLCRIGVRTFPALASARLVRAWGAVRIMTADGLPVYDEASDYPGAFVVTCHSGVTLASVHALELGPALAAGTLGPAPGNMRSTRFAPSPR
ncbi:NAD(P)/FAD-dependent oxidoreductase [Rhodobium gokarnense]|uniref:Glycine/D-amino acid oxidase-like deaminating enzyme n=1 Tax=Rhodobium gokarnense TaxID=364296 RepID=A0ABT3HBE0_9HYPH|nr:FAD-dependent oxidoreductase [Rhodobium gokarnense]MCW2307713.1 glycine/D-amino acid oxidase-like deaminating enzyme [Rhodobium gokarnense]